MPDLKRKYESKIDNFMVATFGVGKDVRDIGDMALNRETITGKSGPVITGIVQVVPNPTVKSSYKTFVPAGAVKTITVTSLYSTSVA